MNYDFLYIHAKNKRYQITKSVNKKPKPNRKKNSDEVGGDVDGVDNKSIRNLSGPKKLVKANTFGADIFNSKAKKAFN